MTSHSSHSVTAVTALPHLFHPAEIAEALGCSEWWVKEQARKGRIPCTRPAGAYRFTAEHYAEIVRLFEERPSRSMSPVPAEETAAALRPRRPRRSAPVLTNRLQPKRPRRVERAEPALAVA